MKRLYTYIFLLLTSLSTTLNAQSFTEIEITGGTLSGTDFQPTNAHTEYKLMGDVILTSSIEVTDGYWVKIDLNGYTMSASSTWTTWPFFMMRCQPGATLTIKDSAPNRENLTGTASGITGGIITNTKGDSERGGAIRVEGKLIMEGGTIYKCTANATTDDDSNAIHVYTNGCGGGVFVYYGGTFEMTGGAIRECNTELNWIHTVTIEGTEHKVTGCGGGVYVCPGALFTMSGGIISDCSAGHGGGVYVNGAGSDECKEYSQGIFNLSGGIITNSKSIRGGAIHTKGDLTMTGGTISNCISTHTSDEDSKQIDAFTNGCGGGVFVSYGGTFTMNGDVSIKNCSTDLLYKTGTSGNSNVFNVTSCGGGVYVCTGATFTMNDGEISNCNAGCGGGVFVNSPYNNPETNEEIDYSDTNGTFTMTGGRITNNTIAGCSNIGGGVCAKGTISMSGGEISYNRPGDLDLSTKADYPYFVYQDSYYNTAVANGYYDLKGLFGGGVALIGADANFTMSGGTIKGNMASSGGGVLLWGGETKEIDGTWLLGWGNQFADFGRPQFTMNGGIIEENYAVGQDGMGNGGGIYNVNSVTKINSGSVRNNYARQYGGGININAAAADLEFGNNGEINITGNQSQHGGGISQSGGTCEIDNTKMFISNNLAHGKIRKCTIDGYNYTYYDELLVDSGNGGGIQINNATLSINGCTIKGNKAYYTDGTKTSVGNGGGLFMTNCDITIGTCNFESNQASRMGGGVFLKQGSFTVSNNANFTTNSAAMGGGICVYNCDVTINDGSIYRNTAGAYGGGLFIYNAETSYTDVNFSGGTFTHNTAGNGGGGMALIGKINATMNALVESNTAGNGGGIYLGVYNRDESEGAKLNFGTGTIIGNYAQKKDNTVLSTAYDGLASNSDGDGDNPVQGIGGGIFMGKGTTLTFSSPKNMGLYNNSADNGADDIFANGNNTNVTLPNLQSTSLTGFNGPTSGLNWMEDYVTADTKYSLGTKISGNNDGSANILRYQYALRNKKRTYPVEIPNNTQVFNTSNGNGYLCLAVGYELVYLKLVKKGLLDNDDAAFKISYKDSEGNEQHYTDVFFTGVEGNADVSRTVALPAGEWKFTETAWGWRYNKPTFSPAHAGSGSSISEGYLKVSYDKTNPDNIKTQISNGSETAEDLTITNTVKSGYEKGAILEHSHRKVNRINPNSRSIATGK